MDCKIPAKYGDILFKLLLTAIMGLIMSIAITFLNIGISEDFFEKWIIAFAGGFVISFPVVLIAVPIAKRIVAKAIVQSKGKPKAF